MMTLIDAARIDLDADCLEHFLLPCSFWRPTPVSI
jgi:hypothetical protein